MNDNERQRRAAQHVELTIARAKRVLCAFGVNREVSAGQWAAGMDWVLDFTELSPENVIPTHARCTTARLAWLAVQKLIVRPQRFRRHIHRVGRLIDRSEVEKVPAAFDAFRLRHGTPESCWERCRALVDALLADPPLLYPGEHAFLEQMQVRLGLSGKGPTKKQAAWIENIARRRQRQ